MFHIPSTRAHVEATAHDVVLSLLRAHTARQASFATLGATAEITVATGAPETSLVDALLERLAPRAAGRLNPTAPGFADLVLLEGERYLIAVEALPNGAAVELYALGRRDAADLGKPLAVLLHGLPWMRQGDNLTWLDASVAGTLAPLLRSERAGASALRDDIANVLQTPEVRRSLASLRQGPVTLPAPEREHDILAFAGLARKQFGLVCSRVEPGRPLMTFAEEGGIRLLFDAGARCPRCSEPFTSADFRVIYSLTEEGTASLTEPHWVLLPLARALRAEGTRVDPLPVTRGGQGVGMLVYCGGWTVVMHVYDRDVARDDMMRLSASALELQADHVVVLTTGSVRREAREFLAEVLSGDGPNGPREIGHFEAYDPQDPAPVLAWWNELAANRLLDHLENRVLSPFRALALPPGLLARSLLDNAREPRKKVVSLGVAVPEPTRVTPVVTTPGATAAEVTR